MPWVRFDDRFDDQDDIDLMSCEAIALNLCATTWSSRNRTDGFIPEARARRLPGGTAEAIQQLCSGDKPWWERVEGGYQIRSFLKYNPSAEDVRAYRQAAAERKAKSRDGYRADATNGADDVTGAVTDAGCHTVTDAVTDAGQRPENAACHSVSPSRVPVSRIPYPDIPNDDDARVPDAPPPEVPEGDDGDGGLPWWDDHPDRLAATVATSILAVPKFAEYGPPGQARVEKFLADVREFAPNDDAIRYELENWETFNRENRKKGGQKDAVAALRNWYQNKRGAWALAKKREAERLAGRNGQERALTKHERIMAELGVSGNG